MRESPTDLIAQIQALTHRTQDKLNVLNLAIAALGIEIEKDKHAGLPAEVDGWSKLGPMAKEIVSLFQVWSSSLNEIKSYQLKHDLASSQHAQIDSQITENEKAIIERFIEVNEPCHFFWRRLVIRLMKDFPRLNVSATGSLDLFHRLEQIVTLDKVCLSDDRFRIDRHQRRHSKGSRARSLFIDNMLNYLLFRLPGNAGRPQGVQIGYVVPDFKERQARLVNHVMGQLPISILTQDFRIETTVAPFPKTKAAPLLTAIRERALPLSTAYLLDRSDFKTVAGNCPDLILAEHYLKNRPERIDTPHKCAEFMRQYCMPEGRLTVFTKNSNLLFMAIESNQYDLARYLLSDECSEFDIAWLREDAVYNPLRRGGCLLNRFNVSQTGSNALFLELCRRYLADEALREVFLSTEQPALSHRLMEKLIILDPDGTGILNDVIRRDDDPQWLIRCLKLRSAKTDRHRPFTGIFLSVSPKYAKTLFDYLQTHNIVEDAIGEIFPTIMNRLLHTNDTELAESFLVYLEKKHLGGQTLEAIEKTAQSTQLSAATESAMVQRPPIAIPAQMILDLFSSHTNAFHPGSGFKDYLEKNPNVLSLKICRIMKYYLHSQAIIKQLKGISAQPVDLSLHAAIDAEQPKDKDAEAAKIIKFIISETQVNRPSRHDFFNSPIRVKSALSIAYLCKTQTPSMVCEKVYRTLLKIARIEQYSVFSLCNQLVQTLTPDAIDELKHILTNSHNYTIDKENARKLLLTLILPKTTYGGHASPRALELLQCIDHCQLAWITDELLTSEINSSINQVKQWGLCFLIRRAMMSLPKRQQFSSIQDFKEALCARCVLLNNNDSGLPDDMMAFALGCHNKNTVDFRRVLCDNISKYLQQAVAERGVVDSTLHEHFSHLLDPSKQLTYQSIYRLCSSYFEACQDAASSVPNNQSWMLLYSTDELARELTLRLRVMPGSAISGFDASTTVSLAIAEYAGIEGYARISGGSNAIDNWIPKLIETSQSTEREGQEKIRAAQALLLLQQTETKRQRKETGETDSTRRAKRPRQQLT